MWQLQCVACMHAGTGPAAATSQAGTTRYSLGHGPCSLGCTAMMRTISSRSSGQYNASLARLSQWPRQTFVPPCMGLAVLLAA